MDQVILDLGSDANVLPKQTWERMGKPTLQWSPIQLRMTNQQKILPMGSQVCLGNTFASEPRSRMT